MLENNVGKAEICCVSIASGAAGLPGRLRRRRSLLKSGASTRALRVLLAMPMAVSVGVALSRPAQATNIGPTNPGIVLSTYGLGDNPFTIGNGTLVSATNTGVFGSNEGAWTLTNAGTVTSSDGTGISFALGGTIVNTGTVLGADALAGEFGIYIGGAAGTVSNQKTVIGFTGVEIGDGGLVSNTSAGMISGAGEGVYLANTAATLQNDGLISQTGNDSGAAAEMHGGYIDNTGSGQITANGAGVRNVGADGTLNNQGTISGATGVDFEHAGVVWNSSTIGGSDIGVSFANGGYVSNSGAGLISGGSDGVFATGAAATVVNAGTIDPGGTAVELDDGGTVTNFGSITGGTVGVSISGGAGTIFNDGHNDADYIHGTAAGVIITSANGTVITRGLISQNGTNDSDAAIIMDGGYIYNQGSHCGDGAGQIVGTSNGIIGIGADALTIVNEGLISGVGAYRFSAQGVILGSGGGMITNGDTAEISANDDAIRSNFGSFNVNNYGDITGGEIGIASYKTGSGRSGSGGVNITNNDLLTGGEDGVFVTTGAANIGNSGAIRGDDDVGIVLGEGGSVLNTRTGLITGGYDGIDGYGASALVHNYGLVAGYSHDGIALTAGGEVLNSDFFNINNFAFYQSTIVGHFDGVTISGGSGSVGNDGLIIGETHNGVELHTGGQVVNSGFIYGKYTGVQIGYNLERHDHAGVLLNDDGTIVGNLGDAAVLYGGGFVYNEGGGTIVNVSAEGYALAMYGSNSTVVNNGYILAQRSGQAVRFYNGGTLFNDGLIHTGVKGVGVYLRDGGTIFNEGSIYGGFGVAEAGPGFASIDNIGNITGVTVGVSLHHGGYVNNDYAEFGSPLVTGTIYGRQVGVQIDGVPGSVNNYGYIGGGAHQTYGVGVKLTDGGIVWNDTQYYDGALTNGTIICGDVGVQISRGAGYVFNTGTIIGGTVGVGLYAGGRVNNNVYDYFNGVNSYVTFGQISGGRYGVFAASVASAGVYNAGLIGGDDAGVALLGGGYVINNGPSATILGNGYGVKITGGSGYVFNSHVIEGFEHYGVYLQGGGQVVNTQSAVIAGYGTGVVIGDPGDVGAGVAGSLYNAGFIAAGSGSGTGVAMLTGGNLTNTASGTIIGSQGVYFYAPNDSYNSIVNAGSIIGDYSNGAEIRGGGVTGVYNQSGGTISSGAGVGIGAEAFAVSIGNAGQISGGFAGIDANDDYFNASNLSGGVITGGSYGVDADAFGVIISNTGSIGGGSIGVFIPDSFYTQLTNQSGGAITGGSYGVEGVADFFSLSNDGSIFGGNSGVFIHNTYEGSVGNAAGGTIVGNSGAGVNFNDFDYGSLVNAGSIQGGEYGAVFINGNYINVDNQLGGTIVGGEVGVYINHESGYGTASITNAGSIWGLIDGVKVLGGSFASVINNEGGTIFGYYDGAVLEATANSLDNAGLISSDEYDDAGVFEDGAANALVNEATGTIAGYSVGAWFDGGSASIDNAGLIEAFGTDDEEYGDGLYVNTGSADITNEQTGTISGSYNGLYSDADNLEINNAGLIEGAGYEGIQAYDGTLASVTNETTGRIYGIDYGADLEDSANYLDNAGVITGTEYEGVYASGSLSSIINEAGGTITGGEEGIYTEADVAGIINSGLIRGTGDYGIETDVYTGFVDNLAGGTIIGGYDGLYIEGDNVGVVNSGLIEGGDHEFGIVDYAGTLASVVNEAGGTIVGPYSGVSIYDGTQSYLANSGFIGGKYAVILENVTNSLVNASTGTIIGSEDGVFLDYGAQMTNAGLIEGTTFAGVALYDGGVLINSGTIIGGETGVYSGYHSPYTYDVAGTVFNGGVISGGSIGVHLFNGGEVANAAGGAISGGAYGVEVGYQGSAVAGFGTIYNAGTISGGGTGVLLENGGLLSNEAGGVVTGGTYGVTTGYTGATLTNTGTIFNAGLISGDATAIVLNNGGAVTNDAGGTISGGQDGIDAGGAIASSISNSGTIIGTAGTGVALNGGVLTNNATGLIQGGTDGVTAGDGAVIVNAGTILDAPAAGHAGVELSGTASLTNLASGTISGDVGVLVSGDNATIFDAGTIISTDGGDAIQVLPTADPVQITLTTGSSISGAIDGGGTGGQITLTGQNTLNDTIANFGAGSALTIAPGANWTGAGNWTIANVDNTGTFQAGMLNVPLNITGNFTSSGTLQVIVTPTVSTQLVVSGTATLSGNLTYVFAPGTYNPGETYDFVTAAGGASGTFSDVTYVGATPSYVSKTTNIVITGNTLGSNLVLGRVAPLDDSVFSDLNQNQAIQAQAANDEVLGKAAGDSGANAAACEAAESVMPDHTSPRGQNTASALTSAVANAFCGAGGWIEATGSTAHIDNSGDGLGYSANDAGFLAGVDRPVTGFGTKLGLAVGYDNSWLNDKDGGKGSADTFRVGLYADQPAGPFNIAADIMYGHATDTTTRETGAGATSANFDSGIVNGGVQINTGLSVQGVSVTPAAGIKFASAGADSFSETAPALLAAFKVNGGSSIYTSVEPYLNLGISKIFTTGSMVMITPEASIGYQLEAGDRGKSVETTAPDGTMFASDHTSLDAGGAQVEAGISAGKDNWAFYAKYAATLSGNWTAQAGEAGLQIRF